MKTRHRWAILALPLFLVVGGCGGSGLVSATGRLTYRGQPVPSTYVFFHPREEGQRASNGLTNDNGEFTLLLSRQEEGVLRGEHTVSLRYYVSVEEELKKIPPKASKEMQEIIARYGDPSTSQLHYEVKKSGQHF